jgi:hypothetical protein
MPLPLHAIWFPVAKTVLILRNGADSPAFFCESETVDQLGPRASSKRRRYWGLPAQGFTKLVAVDERATYELFGAPDGVTVPLVLDTGMVSPDVLLLVSCRRGDRAASAMQLEFLANDVADASELHRKVRDVLGLGEQDHVEGIWTSPIARNETGIHLGPARAAWPYGRARSIEVLLPSAAGLMSELALTARTDHYVVPSGDQPSTVRLSLSAPGAVVLLAWRSTFAGRLNTDRPNTFLQTFQDNIAQYLGWSIPFNRVPPAPNAMEQPIARGYFLPKSGLQPELIPPGEPLTLTFRGPLDIDDIVMLCICSQPADLVDIIQQREGSQPPYRPDDDDLQRQILCWRVTIRGLVPLAWDDIEPKIRSALMERQEAELREARAATATAAAAASSAEADVEVRARSAAPRGSLIDPASLFGVDDELRGVVDEWFATLDPTIIERLCSGLAHEPVPFTNIARFLPVDIDGMLDSPANWAVFERDAEALQSETAKVQSLLDPATDLPRGHLRANSRIWRSIRRAMSEMQTFDEANLQLIDALLPTPSGSLPKLDPRNFYKTTLILGQLARGRLQLPVDGSAADSSAITPGA